MKHLVILLGLILFASPIFAQDIGGDGSFRANKAQLFKTYTTYTASSDDTSGYITINAPALATSLLLASEVSLIWVSTDSTAADVNVIATNDYLTTVKFTTYTDSIVVSDSVAAGSNAGTQKVIVLKSPTVNRFPGATRVKVGTVFRAAGQGTTAGRTGKWFVQWVK
jgi:hypothetical protein